MRTCWKEIVKKNGASLGNCLEKLKKKKFLYYVCTCI